MKILLTVFILSFLIKLGSSPLLEIDEAIYAEVAREAFVSGDYFSTYYNFETEFSKPPLQYWLLQISYAIFGVNELAVRLPSFLMVVGVLFLTYHFGKNIRSPDTGLWACLILCANPGFYSMTRDARMDITLTFFITLSIYGFYNYIYKGQNYTRGFLYVYIGMAGATLTKGPIGIIFPVSIISLFILLRREWDCIRKLRPFHGLLLLILLITPWYLYMTYRYGFEFLEKNIIHENFKKFLVKGVYEPNPGGHFFLAHTFLWYFFPWWLLWFYQQYRWILNSRLKPAATNEKDTIIYLLLWFYIPLIFFSLSKFSLPNYLSIILPSASLGVGLYIDSNLPSPLLRKEGMKGWSSSIVVEYMFSLFSIPLLIIILVSAFSFFTESLNITAYLFISGAVISIFLILISGIYKNFLLTKVGMVLLVMVIQLLVSLKFQPIFDTYKPAKPISEAIKKVSGKEFEIGFYKTRLFQSLVFYTGKKLNGIGSEDSMLQFINSPKERFVITEENEYNLLPQDYRNEMVVIGRFPFFPISRISYSFLNPKTREEVIKYIVLIGKKQYA
ncbi:MAG: glycosyltransferase family 39 protein [Nitrospinae bacterium]|nr:glycosyltransferase family 39 protein [Nitrospinota bacterium]